MRRVFIAGTTGESLSLTLDERFELVEMWEKVTKADDIDVDYIVHIGAEGRCPLLPFCPFLLHALTLSFNLTRLSAKKRLEM